MSSRLGYGTPVLTTASAVGPHGQQAPKFQVEQETKH